MIDYQKLPKLIYTILMRYNAYITGSTVDYLLGSKETHGHDFDMVVLSPEDYHEILQIMPDRANTKINPMGGVEICLDSVKIDIWPDTVHGYFERVQEMGLNNTKLLSIKPKLLITGTSKI